MKMNNGLPLWVDWSTTVEVGVWRPKKTFSSFYNFKLVYILLVTLRYVCIALIEIAHRRAYIQRLWPLLYKFWKLGFMNINMLSRVDKVSFTVETLTTSSVFIKVLKQLLVQFSQGEWGWLLVRPFKLLLVRTRKI
jgi:hypothetical protein